MGNQKKEKDEEHTEQHTQLPGGEGREKLDMEHAVCQFSFTVCSSFAVSSFRSPFPTPPFCGVSRLWLLVAG